MLRRARRYTADCVLVKVRREGVELTVPCWMLDAGVCQGLVDAQQPRLDVAALTELRRLLDSQPLLASPPQKEQHKRRIPKSRR